MAGGMIDGQFYASWEIVPNEHASIWESHLYSRPESRAGHGMHSGIEISSSPQKEVAAQPQVHQRRIQGIFSIGEDDSTDSCLPLANTSEWGYLIK